MRVETVSYTENHRMYHARVEMTDEYDEGQRGLHQPQSAFYSQLLSIPGVQTVFGNGYEVCIKKGGAFTWEEVEPKIKELIAGLESVPNERKS